jgi:hypothetical protein
MGCHRGLERRKRQRAVESEPGPESERELELELGGLQPAEIWHVAAAWGHAEVRARVSTWRLQEQQWREPQEQDGARAQRQPPEEEGEATIQPAEGLVEARARAMRQSAKEEGEVWAERQPPRAQDEARAQER